MKVWVTKKLAVCAIGDEVEAGAVILDVRDLDDYNNNPMVILPKIIMGNYIIQEGCRLAVRCHYGVNRSAAVASAIIALQLNVTLPEAIEFVHSKKPDIHINPTLINQTEFALNYLKRNLGF